MSRISEYQVSGPAAPGRIRLAIALDFVCGLVIAMLAFPFPIVRASVSVPSFVALVLGSIVAVHALYLMVAVSLLGRTPGMYLLDLGFDDGAPGLADSAKWALRVTLLFWPVMLRLYASDDPSRLGGSGLRISTSESDPRSDD